MPRQIQLSVEAARSDGLLGELRALDGLMGLSVHRGASIQPEGDVIDVLVLDRSMDALMGILDRQGLGRIAGLTLVSSMPVSVSSADFNEHIAQDSSRASWEEMELLIGQESNMTPNGMILMFISGVIATLGISSGTLHYVLAAMIIAPGFEPIVRIGLGIVSGSGWRRGAYHTAKAYLVLVVGAFAGSLFLLAQGGTGLEGKPAYFEPSVLINYWSTVSAASITTSILGSIAGAVLISGHRTVLTAGVMVALSLVPAAALTCMALVAGEWELAARAGARWFLEVALVLSLSVLVFAWIRSQTHRRTSMS
jgi:hypothetical protein